MSKTKRPDITDKIQKLIDVGFVNSYIYTILGMSPRTFTERLENSEYREKEIKAFSRYIDNILNGCPETYPLKGRIQHYIDDLGLHQKVIRKVIKVNHIEYIKRISSGNFKEIEISYFNKFENDLHKSLK